MNHADVHKEENGNSSEKSKYYCDTCQKPYGGKNNLAAHLKSKIHLRKLELLENSKENLKSPEKKPNTENEKVDKETLFAVKSVTRRGHKLSQLGYELGLS